MQNLLGELEELLQKEPKFVADGKLLKNKIIEAGLRPAPALLKLLMKHSKIKKHFFQKVDDVLVFDKIKFQKFVSNKQFLANSYTSFKNRIGLSDGDEGYLKESGDVVLNWAYKDCVLEGGMTKEDKGRDEIFYNTTLAPDEITRLFAPKVFTGFEKWDADAVKKGKPKKVKEITEKDSLLIKGNNLLALHCLKQRYAGKVKLIYIDPPYNPPTQTNTFSYNNSFNRSSWLTFMKNRLDTAKQFLARDGALIVAIDDNEFYYLGCLLKEIFPNYSMHCITIVHNPRGIQGTNFSYTHEYAYFLLPIKMDSASGKKIEMKTVGNRKIKREDITWRNLRDNGGISLRTDAKNCFYPMLVRDGEVIGFGDVLSNEKHPKSQSVKGDGCIHVYPIDKEGVERKWRYARQSVDEIKHLLRAKKTKTGYEIEIGKDFGSYRTVWQDPRYDSNEYGTKILKSLVPDCTFSFPKSLYNVYDCLDAIVGDDKTAVVLDFFAGSGTTAHALMQMNKDDGGERKFILIEQMNYIKDLPEARVKEVINRHCPKESFIYCELKEWNERFIQEVNEAKNSQALKAIYKKMKEQAFLRYEVDTEKYDGSDFDSLSFEDQQEAIKACLDMNHLYVNYSEMEDSQYKISDEDKTLTNKFYGK